MVYSQQALTPGTIKYLLTLYELCEAGNGTRCVSLAAKMGVSKPSVHYMIQNLCNLNLARKERYGMVYLTDAGCVKAKQYHGCYEPLQQKMQQSLGLPPALCRSAACALLSEVEYSKLPQLLQHLSEIPQSFSSCRQWHLN